MILTSVCIKYTFICVAIVSHAQERNYWLRLTQRSQHPGLHILVMDNTADKLNELEGPCYDSGTVRALQELENSMSANSMISWPTQNFL